MPSHYEMSLNRHALSLPIVANTTKQISYVAARKEKVVGIWIGTPTAPTSASGTYLLTVMNGATTLLDAANFDLEGLTGGTPEELGLASAAADVTLEEGEDVIIKAVSNNADLVVTGDHLALTVITEPLD